MGGLGVSEIDVSQLPIASPTNQYNLRNAAVAIGTPQPLPPPPGPVEDQPPSPYQIPASALASAPEFSQPGAFANLQVQPQQPQFQQPFQQPGAHDLQPLIDQYAVRMQQDNQQRGQGVLKHLLTSFMGGMGRSMMVHAGLPTPEEAQQRQLQNVIALSHAQSEQQNAQANQALKDIETQRYAMDVAKYPVYGPDGSPVLDDQGKPKLYPKWQAQQLQEVASRAQQKSTPAQATFDYLTRPTVQGGKGMAPDAALDAISKQPTDVPHTVNTAQGVLQYDPDSKTWKKIGGSPLPAERPGTSDARADRSYEFNSKQLTALATPIDTAVSRLGRLQDTLAQNSPQADALIAPELLTVMAGGQGSGLRMNEAEISRIVGGRSNWQSLQAAANRWSLDPSTANSITPSQRQQIRALVREVSRKLTAKQKILSDAQQGLISVDDPKAHRQIIAGAKQQLNAIDSGGSGSFQVTAPDGSVHTFADQAGVDRFKKLAGIQ